MPSSVISPCILLNEEDPEKIGTESAQFPEGGAAAWRTVIGAALVQVCGFGYVTSFGVYQDIIWLTNRHPLYRSTYAFLATSGGLLAGALYDRGYFYYLLIGGSLLQSLMLFMLSFTQPGQYYQIFLAQGIGLGIAQGLIYVPSVAVMSHYFSERRTLAMSLATSGSSLGSVIHPIMLNNLFNGRIGFANGVRISAAFVSVLLFTSCLLMRTRLGQPKHTANYLTIGRGIIHDIPFCIMAMGVLFFQMGFWFPGFYLQLDSVQHGNSKTFSFYSLVLLNGGNLFGRLSTAFIAPHLGVPRLMIISTGICGIFILGMIGLSGIPTVVILGTAYGYFSGVYIAGLSPLMALLTSDLSELGARIGIGMTATGIGSLISGPISGALLTSRYEWWRPSLFCGLIALTGCFLLVVMQLMMTRRECSTKRQECNVTVSQEGKQQLREGCDVEVAT